MGLNPAAKTELGETRIRFWLGPHGKSDELVVCFCAEMRKGERKKKKKSLRSMVVEWFGLSFGLDVKRRVSFPLCLLGDIIGGILMAAKRGGCSWRLE